jgi:hypothetical protein
MAREEAAKRSSNAMWWAGYWAAYSEVGSGALPKKPDEADFGVTTVLMV